MTKRHHGCRSYGTIRYPASAGFSLDANDRLWPFAAHGLVDYRMTAVDLKQSGAKDNSNKTVTEEASNVKLGEKTTDQSKHENLNDVVVW